MAPGYFRLNVWDSRTRRQGRIYFEEREPEPEGMPMLVTNGDQSALGRVRAFVTPLRSHQARTAVARAVS
jgi:hypothetical protein